MDIFFRLLFGHLLADFTFQTNFLAEWKRRRFLGLFVHVVIHPICYIALTWPYLSMTWCTYGSFSMNGWVVILITSVVHFFEDWFRVHAINAWEWSDNTLFYIWDQVVHIVCLWLLTPVHSQPLLHDWPILGILFVLVTHCATVTVWFIEKDIYGRDFPETEEKYLSMLQRLVVWLSFFLPQPWWMLILVFVMVSFARHIWTKKIDFSWAGIIMGNAFAVLCGAFVRYGLKVHF